MGIAQALFVSTIIFLNKKPVLQLQLLPKNFPPGSSTAQCVPLLKFVFNNFTTTFRRDSC
jgi:hypothetical protein